MHPLGVGWLFIFESVQMKQPVNDVKRQLFLKRAPVYFCILRCGLRADDDFAVVERDDIRRARYSHEIAMHFGDGRIGNEGRFDFLQPRQNRLAPFRARERFFQGERSEPPQPRKRDGEFSLPVIESDFQWMNALPANYAAETEASR